MKKKTIIVLLALVLVFGLSAGWTIAYLTSATNTVVNNFVVAKVGALVITESENVIENGRNSLTGNVLSTADGDLTNEYIVIPGVDIQKDPEVEYIPAQTAGTTPSADPNNIPVYVFLKVDAGSGWSFDTAGTALTRTVGTGADAKAALSANINTAADSGWTVLDAAKYPGVYCFEYDPGASTPAATARAVFAKIGQTDNTIQVLPSLNTAELSGIEGSLSDLAFSAYSIQQDGFADAEAAWTTGLGNTAASGSGS